MTYRHISSMAAAETRLGHRCEAHIVVPNVALRGALAHGPQLRVRHLPAAQVLRRREGRRPQELPHAEGHPDRRTTLVRVRIHGAVEQLGWIGAGASQVLAAVRGAWGPLRMRHAVNVLSRARYRSQGPACHSLRG